MPSHEAPCFLHPPHQMQEKGTIPSLLVLTAVASPEEGRAAETWGTSSSLVRFCFFPPSNINMSDRQIEIVT